MSKYEHWQKALRKNNGSQKKIIKIKIYVKMGWNIHKIYTKYRKKSLLMLTYML